VSTLWAYLAAAAAAGLETVIWLVGQKPLVSYWDVTTDTPSSSASPGPSDIQTASGPVMNT
jgi:hypothetical protein